MGLLDRFKKKEQAYTPNLESRPQRSDSPFDITYSTTPEGLLQIDFYDKKADFKQFYDTTRLIMDNSPLTMAGQEVYRCAVSWYGQSDCEYLNRQTGTYENIRASDYKSILAQIDVNSLQRDSNYCRAVMKKLLEQKRVEKYLENGLQENPERPCGNYIGGISSAENGYKKFFSLPVGRASHNSPSMVTRRQEHRREMEADRQRAIADRRSQIARLESEINGLEK